MRISLLFLGFEFRMILYRDQEIIESRLELLSFINPSEVDTSSTNFQMSISLDIGLGSFIITRNSIGPSL